MDPDKGPLPPHTKDPPAQTPTTTAGLLKGCVDTLEHQNVTLVFAAESARLVSALLDAATRLPIGLRKRVPPIVAVASSVSPHARSLSELLDEWQMLNRMWCLLDVWVAHKELIRRLLFQSARLRLADLGEIAENITLASYHIFEAASVLCARNIIPSRQGTADKLLSWSCRLFLVLLGIDLVRLVKERLKAKSEDWSPDDRASWYSRLLENVGWGPIFLHWSGQESVLSEVTLGAASFCAAAVPMRSLWGSTASQ